MAIAGVAALGLIGYELKKCVSSYADYVGAVAKAARFTGMTAKQSSYLIGQFRLSHIVTDKATVSLRFFAKNLDAAREGFKKNAAAAAAAAAKGKDYVAKLNPSQTIFKRLGLTLKDNNGHWKTGAQLLTKVRDAFSKMHSPIARTSLMLKLFGRSGTDMQKWLTKTPKQIQEMNKYVRELHLVFGNKAIKTYKQYLDMQDRLSLATEAFRINIAQAFIPLLNEYLPKIANMLPRIRDVVVGALAKMAHWVDINKQKFIDFADWIQKHWKAVVAGIAFFKLGGGSLLGGLLSGAGKSIGGKLLGGAAGSAAAGAAGKTAAKAGMTMFGISGTAFATVLGAAIGPFVIRGLLKGLNPSGEQGRGKGVPQDYMGAGKGYNSRGNQAVNAKLKIDLSSATVNLNRWKDVAAASLPPAFTPAGRAAAKKFAEPVSTVKIPSPKAPVVAGGYMAGLALGAEMGAGVAAGFSSTFNIQVAMTDSHRRRAAQRSGVS